MTIERDSELNEDFQPEKMKRLPRGAFLARPGDTTNPKKTKIRVTLYLDSDILAYFKERAAEPNAAPYQTQINNELRSVLERNSQTVAVDYTKLLNNRNFIRALAEEVAEYRAESEKQTESKKLIK
ncbi:MAG: BrnA antitoxin family protein [Caldilineaceae bacterium]